jgi:flagellar export protein FliJ
VKRYHFRLEAILRLRAAQEEQARAGLRQAEQDLRAALAARDAELARYRALRRTTGPVPSEEFHKEEVVATLAAATLGVAEREVAVVAEGAVRARVVWSEAARRVAILERLDERRRAEHDEEERRADVVLVDDIVTARYVADELERHRDERGVSA